MENPLSYIELIKFIIDRFDKYISGIRDRKEQNAARILKSANILKVSLRELDDFFKDNMRPLRLFDPNCDDKERRKLKEKIIEFAERKNTT